MARGKSTKNNQLALDDGPIAPIQSASLVDEAQKRYLQYALSVITSRALPDVRDGLKPVQRRILYAMYHELHLRFENKHRKCALVVGDVMGKFHPHGDTAIYDALVRLAQSFSMRLPLVDGRGNFGSPDGDSAAAMRYTEARLAKVAEELLLELGKKTVPFRPNYDGTRFEPVVLPARFPHLLVNGSQGIAVGMATSIPPHALSEVIDACVALIEEPDLSVGKLLKWIKGPDFPTGGLLLSTRKELEQVYSSGQGTLKLRGEWSLEEEGRGNPNIILSSIPYAVERRTVVEQIAQVIIQKKLPILLDVRDESTEKCRVVLEIKKEADPQLVMAYLFKHTALQSTVQINLTCLVPTDNADIATPERVDIKRMLREFLDYRLDVVTRRISFDLNELRERIHILEGFEKVFEILDEVIRIIRRSNDRQDAAAKLMTRFELDEVQVNAILELRLYKLARLEIELIQKELREKRTEAKRLDALLKSEKARWGLIRDELSEIREAYKTPRLTKIVGDTNEPTYSAEAFIIDEDTNVILTQQGWLKRQRAVKDVGLTRTREGDQVLNIEPGSTKASLAAFSSLGVCYVCRIVDIPATTGHGSPVQTLFKLADGERIVRIMSFDPRVLEVPPQPEGGAEAEPPFAIGVTRLGMAVRFSLRGHREPSTKSGRKYMRLKEGDETLFVSVAEERDLVACASSKGHALICSVKEVAVLTGPGRGVTLIKLGQGDALVGAALLNATNPSLRVVSESGKEFELSKKTREVTARGGKGAALFKRGQLAGVVPVEISVPDLGGASA